MPFKPEGLGLDIFKSRYAAHENETWEEACERVANHVANAEFGDNRPKYKSEFERILVDNLFMPGGRIFYGSGRAKGQLLNCFVIPTEDSREGWGKSVSDSIVISGTGGGVGINCSPIRPRGIPVKGSGGVATGAVSLMEIINAAGEVIKAGGGRRTALMLCLDISHGDIEEFLNKKLDLNKLNNANVSVMFNEDPEEFFRKVKNDEQFDLLFKGKVVGSVKAKDLWTKIVHNAYKNGEPGILNGHYANKMSNIYYHARLTSTNPCVTGDTLVAVADGRNAVSIKQLAEEGKDVPVYSIHPGTGEVQIKWGVNPRKTGEMKEVWKVTLDDGSTVRATTNHKFVMRDLSTKQLKDLKPGDSLQVTAKWKTSWKEIFKQANSRSQDYWAIHDGKKMRFEHGMIAEFNLGRKITNGEVVHHKNYKGLDNSPENLAVMSKEEHDYLHRQNMLGDKNPYHRMSDDWKHDFASHPGEENGMFGKENKWGNHTEDAKKRISEKHLGKKLSKVTKEKLSIKAIERAEKKYIDAGIPQHVKKSCPACSAEFTVHWNAREQMYCSHPCSMVIHNQKIREGNKQKWEEKRKFKREALMNTFNDLKFSLKREPMEKEFQNFCKERGISSRFTTHMFKNFSDLKQHANDFNHRVVSIEFDCYEDVYNITVEDNHIFQIVLNVPATTKTGKDKQYHISTRQCGEIFMSPYDCCCLGAVVLPRFVKGKKVDWSALEEAVKLGVRFLDDVLAVNNYPLQEIADTCSNLRRVGLGVMGLHDMLLTVGLKYNSPEGLEFVDKVMNFIKNASYEASIELAKEKGAFPAFDAEKYLKSAFVKTLKPTIRKQIAEHGIRNCALNTIAPTGTTSMVCGMTSGVEPMFASAYERRFWKGDAREMEVVIHPLFKKFIEEGQDTSHFQGAFELSVRDHFEMQRTCQKHMDNAVSKTINIDVSKVSVEELSDLYMEYLPELKGITIYPEGSRENQPLTPLSSDEAFKHVADAIAGSAGLDACKSGVCDV